MKRTVVQHEQHGRHAQHGQHEQHTRSARRKQPGHQRVVLVTGFEPFGGDAINPSAMLAQALDGQRLDGKRLDGQKLDGQALDGQGLDRHALAGHVIAGRVLPCVFDLALIELSRAIDELQPAIVLCTGLAAGRHALSFERVAINLVDARIADNAGAAPVDERVARSRRDAWFANLPVKAMAQAAVDAGVAAELSLSAGTFVCNAVFFALMQRVARERRAGRPLRGGFMHVPNLAGEGRFDPGAMDLEDMVCGTRAALLAACTQSIDLRVAAGTVA